MTRAERLANCAAGNHRFDTRRYVDRVEIEFVGLKISRVDAPTGAAGSSGRVYQKLKMLALPIASFGDRVYLA